MTNPEILDMFKRTVNIGDTIAAGFRSGNTGQLRLGKVIQFKTKNRFGEVIPTIEVEWISPGGWTPEKSQIEFDNGRFAVVILPVDITD